MRFKGNLSNRNKLLPSIWLKKCRGLNHCKTEEEIDEYASNVFLTVMMINSVYEPDEYNDEFVKKNIWYYSQKANSGEAEKKYSYTTITEERIESDHKFYSFGFLKTLDTIYAVPEEIKTENLLIGFDKDTMVAFAFYLNSYRSEHSRQIYGPLDCLGDIGGLVDALVGIGSAILYVCTLISPDHLDTHFI